MNNTLFRSEVSNIGRGKHFGKVKLDRLKIYSVASISAVLVLTILILGIAFVPIERRSMSYGVLISDLGSSHIPAPISGVVNQIFVEEGGLIKVGDPIARITNEVQTDGSRNSNEKIIESLEGRKRIVEQGSTASQGRAERMVKILKQKIEGYDSEIERVKSSHVLEKTKHDLLRQRESNIANLVRENFVSQAQLVDRQIDVINQKARIEDLDRQFQTLLRGRISTTQEMEAAAAEAAANEENAARAVAALDQELTEVRLRSDRTLRSPRSGIVTGLLSKVGNSVNAGQLVAVVVPDTGNLEAEVYVPAKSISRVVEGMSVDIRYEAFPYQIYGQADGAVISITSTPIQPKDFNSVLGIRSVIVGTEPIYRVRIRLRNQNIGARPLRAGMALSAGIVSERKTIWHWLSDDFDRVIRD